MSSLLLLLLGLCFVMLSLLTFIRWLRIRYDKHHWRVCKIVNINNGERIETYVIAGERGAGGICLNGPAARRVAVGDIIIIIAYGYMDFEEAKTFKPTLVFPNTETNKLD